MGHSPTISHSASMVGGTRKATGLSWRDVFFVKSGTMTSTPGCHYRGRNVQGVVLRSSHGAVMKLAKVEKVEKENSSTLEEEANMKSNAVRFVLIALILVAIESLAQESPAKPEAQAKATQAQARQTLPLTVEEKSAVERMVLSDARIRKIVGAEKPRIFISEARADKAEAEAFLEGTTDKLPAHWITVVVFNPRTNKAAQILMSLDQHQIQEVQQIKVSEVPFARDDADEALTLAKANPDLHRVVGSRLEQFVLLESGSNVRVPLAAQALPLLNSNPDDPCSADRCLDLIFRTETGYLPVRATVDLTTRTVKITSRERREGGDHK
jgi:hypothetical protein